VCPYITYAIGTPVADCAYFSRRAKEENKKKAQRLQNDEWKEKEKEEDVLQDGYEVEAAQPVAHSFESRPLF
jgi:hypothetical protein